ncbi:40S ribosomal protein SA [Histomonas meleagridis]|uniref:40S ribosomal protein SA n=1 Tax=Histomonas meleagridis TaxID=135588 RepID=UPI0035594D17|nr:40S ribosomal protein SA [Histomonas meleagridis]KAH0805114.1 40S ribosomal protein SA [Histomonas meleagridis]
MQADREASIKKMLAAKVHIGSSNLSFGMQPYVFTRTKTGTHIINLGMTYEKIKLAARMIYAVEEPRDVLAISAKPFGQRAVHKFSQFLGCLCINQRFTPGFFTNHSIKGKFMEPRLIIVCDPNTDTQAITEAAYANIPCIALCDTDASLRFVDCVIPCNTKNKTSIGLVMWLLTREVLRLRGELLRTQEWKVLPDLYFYRDTRDEQNIQEQIDHEGEETVATDVTTVDAAPAADGAAPSTEQEWNNAGEGAGW